MKLQYSCAKTSNFFSGRSSTIAGAESSCDCAFRGCNCYEGDGDFARNARLHGPSALTVMPDGTLFVADQSNARIRKVYKAIFMIIIKKFFHKSF